MKRFEATKAILDLLKDDDIALFTTGMISREAFFVKDRSTNFYMVGSMGLISSVGLGIALNTNKRVVIFDGDGSALMDLGTMAMIASEKPSNLIHIILDNKVYQSTGSQPTISSRIDLSSIAKSTGYHQVAIIEKDIAGEEIKLFLQRKGPSCIVFKINKQELPNVPRINLSPQELMKRIREVIVVTD